MSVVVRVAAFVVAVGLVVGALAIRGDRTGSTGDPVITDDVTASCPTDLFTLCQRATARVTWERSGSEAIAGALTGTEPVVALLPAAWADLVDDERVRAGRAPLARADVGVSTPLLLVAFADRAAVLAEACGTAVDALDWSCVGEHAGRSWEDLGGDVRWGTVRLGHADPHTALGLQATTTVVAARTGVPFSLSDLRAVDFTTWFARVERSVGDFTPPGGSHLTGMVTRGPSVANVAVATEADVATRGLETAFGPIIVAAPEPLLTVELVVVGPDASAVDTVAGALRGQDARDALTAAGWRIGGVAPSPPVLEALPPPTPTPNGGVLTAVRATWDDIVG